MKPKLLKATSSLFLTAAAAFGLILISLATPARAEPYTQLLSARNQCLIKAPQDFKSNNTGTFSTPEFCKKISNYDRKASIEAAMSYKGYE